MCSTFSKAIELTWILTQPSRTCRPITTHTTWDNSFVCDGCSERGSRNRGTNCVGGSPCESPTLDLHGRRRSVGGPVLRGECFLADTRAEKANWVPHFSRSLREV